MTKDADYKYSNVIRDVLSEFDMTNAFPETSFEGHEEHKFYCVKYIAEEYIRMRANYVAKTVTLNEHKILIGNRYKKASHFHHQ